MKHSNPRPAYVGLLNDTFGGMTAAGSIIKDAWLFDVIPETETCQGWSRGRIEDLYEKVFKAWEPYGHLVSLLPPDLRKKHKRIHDEALKRAKDTGWDPDLSHED